ncbi:MAG TPA: hypothetical protein VJ385_07030 [Fibrobacteria bacterium]|nr:hypothetical protein [Fibrobacteria bacterium]
MRRNHFLASVPVLCVLLLLSSCEFRSRRAVWRLEAGVTYKLEYSAELRARADGSWGTGPYVSAARAGFSVRAVPDTSKGQIEVSLAADTLDYRSSERGPEEDQYMTGRLRKYKARISLSRTGQILSLEEEPGMPPVEFSPLNFGRFLAYALPAFPDAPIKKGSRWEIVQPLLDKFHPDSRLLKRFTLSAIRETPEGDLATCLVDLEAFLDEDLGSGENVRKPSLTGSGQMVFNLASGRPVSADLELEGRFMSHPPGEPADSSGSGSKPEALPLRLQEKLSLRFSE